MSWPLFALPALGETSLWVLRVISDVKAIDPCFTFDHQGNMDDWLIVEKIEDAVVGTGIPHKYEKPRF